MMTPEERQLLAGLFDRIRAAAGNPRDREAEALIAEAVRTQPYAPYLLAQAVIVQEEGLKAAAARIEELEARVRDLEAQASSGGGSFLGGIGKSIFGDSRREPEPEPPRRGGPWGAAPAAPSQPGSWGQQPTGPQWQQGGGAPGQWSQGGAQPAAPAGGGFLRGALGTAAGVAGGVLLANSLSGLFSGHQGGAHGIGSGLNQNAGAGSDLSGFDPMPKSPGGANSLLDDKTASDRFAQASYDSQQSDDDDDSGDDDDDDGYDDGTTEA